MAKIDRLGWAAGFSFRAYGLQCGIRVSDPAVLPEVLPRLPPSWVPSSRPRVEKLYSLLIGGPASRAGVSRFHLLYAGSERLTRTLELNTALATLESNLKLWVAGTTKQRVFIHAGAVGWKGRGLILPGRTYSGKSRLVEALIKAGCTYYSDEYAVLDEQGRLHPYPALLSLRDGEGGETHRISALALGGRIGQGPLPIGLVAMARYVVGAKWRPRRQSPGRGMLDLLDNTVPARRRPRLVVQTLSRVVAHTPVLKGQRGEATDAAARLLDALDQSG